MFTPLQKLLPQAAAKLGMRRQIEAALICEKYRQLAAALIHREVLRHTCPKFFRAGTLTIGVENSAWAEKIAQHKKSLLDAINTSIKTPSVQRIRTEVVEKMS